MKEVILLVLLIAAMITDIRYGKIPNGLIVTGWMLACIIQTGSSDVIGGILACRDAICLIVICLPLFLVHVIGAGDIKLWSVIAAMQGLFYTWQTAVVFILTAGAYSLIRMLQKKILVERFYYLVHFIHISLTRQRYADRQTDDGISQTKSRYYDKQRDGTACTIKLAPFTVIAYIAVWAGRGIGLC